MKVELLEADLDELGAAGIEPHEAFARGLKALGRRPIHEKPREVPGTAAATAELVHLVAEATADLRLLRFSFATKAGDYHRSRARHDAVDREMADLRRELAPRFRARLRELRLREAELERELRERGVDPSPIGPHVPRGEAVDPTPKPGEGDEERQRLSRLPPRRGLFERLFRRWPA